MQGGRLWHKLQFQRIDGTTNQYGDISGDFVDLFATRGNVRETTGKERIAAGSVENVRTATIRLRKNSKTETLREADRVIARGETWDILGIANVDDQGAMLDLAVRAIG